MKPLYIFDLDGTLAITEHRQHILDQTDNPHRWRDFFAACVDDQPNLPVIQTLDRLSRSGADIWIWSGRSDEVLQQTQQWILRWIKCGNYAFRMRSAQDYTPDDELKALWLSKMPPRDRERLVAVFDDRAKVVAMWRRNGVACFQVAPGDF